MALSRASLLTERTPRRLHLERLEEHFDGIFQRRHDCIHNCDRPKNALQPISPVTVDKVIADIEFLVCRCHEAMTDEFPEYQEPWAWR